MNELTIIGCYLIKQFIIQFCGPFLKHSSIYSRAINSLLETFLLDEVMIQTIIDSTSGNNNLFLSIYLSMNHANFSHNDALFTSVILHLINLVLCLYRFCVLSSILYSPDNFDIFLPIVIL